jgi:hypothetical protein
MQILNSRALKCTVVLDRAGDKRLAGGGPSMPDEQRNEHIKVLIEQRTAQRRESDMALARRLSRLLISEREKSLPADVPLHKRGFGVMDK